MNSLSQRTFERFSLWILIFVLCLSGKLVGVSAQTAPQRLLRDSREAIQRGDISSARLFLETLTELYPNSPEAAEGWFRRGQIENAELFLDEAIKCFQQVISHPSASPRLAAIADISIGLVGIRKFLVGRWKVRKNGEEEDWFILTGRSFWQVLDDAQKHLESAVKKYERQDPDLVAISKLAIARIWILRQFPRLAERTYWEVLKKWSGKNPVFAGLALYGIAVAKAKQDEYEEAIHAFNAFLNSFQAGKALDGLIILSEEWRLKARIWKAFLMIGLGKRSEAISELLTAEREGWETEKKLKGEARERVRSFLAKVRLWQANLMDELDQREQAEKILIETFASLGDTPEGLRALEILTYLPERRR